MPNRNAVQNLITKFRKTGSFDNAPKSGRPSTSKSKEKVVEVQDMMLKSPKKSVRRLAQQADVSVGPAHKIRRKSLSMYMYKMSVVHELKDTDRPACVDFCSWFLSFLQDNYEGILDTTFFTGLCE
ncbi:uncharacterized protein LOC126099981 [Schistocerca cancellata]|uniref:uncharacterized protein LOC126099981 n=1 Tax=Schistocerca cancellata TaxID=274614 RepID=UPI0021193666|nr:uncharacterized protein LOC126099981 [Schistocerca cancellata]